MKECGEYVRFQGLQMHRALSVRVLESECVLAQPNVWERRSEDQMAALRMERG